MATAKWVPRRMQVSQASAYSPIYSTQKNRTDGRSNVAETHVIT